jgi:ubiquinone/menaquinone biosynthesis C-methylase UbiE
VRDVVADVQPVKDGQKLVWSLGDYRELARVYEPAAVALVEACAVGPGMAVLDVAAGTGNVAVAAARRGARVVASDLTPRMLELGRERSAVEGLDIEWVEADAEDLPFEDGRFDAAASSFGAMFAPRPHAAAAELFRVVRSGGTVGLANMTPQGYLGRLIAVAFSYFPVPPGGLAPPLLWGEPDVVHQRLEELAASVEIQPRMAPIRFASKQAVMEFHERYNGPLIALRSTLPLERYQALRAELDALTDQFNHATDGTVRIDSEYLLVVARKS